MAQNKKGKNGKPAHAPGPKTSQKKQTELEAGKARMKMRHQEAYNPDPHKINSRITAHDEESYHKTSGRAALYLFVRVRGFFFVKKDAATCKQKDRDAEPLGNSPEVMMMQKRGSSGKGDQNDNKIRGRGAQAYKERPAPAPFKTPVDSDNIDLPAEHCREKASDKTGQHQD